MPHDAPGGEPPPPSQSKPHPEPLTEEERSVALKRMLMRHTTQLSEHFSCVQIVATRLEPDGATRGFHKGSGDWFARQGVARAWLNGQLPDDPE